MNSRSLFASILMTFLLTVSIGGFASLANAASAGQSFLQRDESAANNVTEIKYRRRAPVMYVPVGPSYIFYDYPYYYSRGYYPTHIGPHYVYYGPGGVPYSYPYYGRNYSPSQAYSPSQGGRCSYWHRKCTANWGRGNEDYNGCMDHHRCQ